MNSETKTENRVCVNCQKQFTIESEDFSFYEKIKVPPPTWCPECRLQRRYAWRNERTLYRRNCDLCNKSIVTFYSPNKPFKVFCIQCFWGDNWDPASYGRDFDFSRSFFEQFRELQLEVPRIAVFNKNNINSDFTNHSGDNRNCYLSFCCFGGEDIMYSNWIMDSRNCMDCSHIYENGERLYECVDSRKSYGCQYGILLENCIDTLYCYDCRNCTNCFMSSNLRNKSYVFRGKQLTREEYFSRMRQIDFGSYETRQKLDIEFKDILTNNTIYKNTISERNINSSGATLFNSKKATLCFDSDDLEDTKYVYSANGPKSSMDLYHIGWDTELLYETHGGRGYYNSKFCHHSNYGTNLEYCDSCDSSDNLFGCISVKKGKYMILNKKYPPEEYEILKNKIIQHMKDQGEYGEFFPPQVSPVCYNETQGSYYMPLTKEEVVRRGWQWEDNAPGIFHKETILDLSDSIEAINDNILSEILRCISCTRNYNIVSDELIFYKKEKIPIPRKCPECRYKVRFSYRPPRKLWTGICKCEVKEHGHVGKCPNEFETPYAPDRPEKVYCESCYNKEVY